MRDIKPFVDGYADLVLTGMTDLNRFDARDIALVDLSLHFLFRYLPGEKVTIIPSLLQGHLATYLPQEARRRLFTLRQHAGGFCSRLAWRKALVAHAAVETRSAYRVVDGVPVARGALSPSIVEILDGALNRRVEYIRREVRHAEPGHAKLLLGRDVDFRSFKIPNVDLRPSPKVVLQKRVVNPPIGVKWGTLLDVSRSVDEREADPNFPKWMPKLNLFSRLSKVRIEAIEEGFFRDGLVTLDGVSHLVGMLSSGKSTLLHALLFALISPGYEKRVLILSPDTASASQLIARLHAHGYMSATVVSSPRNRDEHLSMAHWNAQGYPAESTLEATAALTRSLGVACPLEGFQPPPQLDNNAERSCVLKLSEKPCHRLKQKGKKDQETDRSCPLITACPVHEQQRSLADARVVAMTAPALLHMTADKAFVPEEMSFPELFQYLSDVVLVDEADSVQTHFDQACTQEKDLLSTNDQAFMISSVRAVVTAIGDRTGRQYQSASNVRWVRELNRLQDSISAIYHLVLRHGDQLRWITDGKTFTTASIFADLLPRETAIADSDQKKAAARTARLEQLAVMSGMLYGTHGIDEEERQVALVSDRMDEEVRGAYEFLQPLQERIIDWVVSQESMEVVEQVEAQIRSGALAIFAPQNDVSVTKKAGQQRRYGKSCAPDGVSERAMAVVLALLTNVCLSSFAYLVRNQAAVEDEFGLLEEDAFREARRVLRHFGSIIPRPMFGTVFGLMFHQAGESRQGGTLKLVNHLGVGRYLLTNLHRLLSDEGQAGPHVVLMSGTSWAGGNSQTASPAFDVQCPVSAILTQPDEELDALSHSRYEFVSLGDKPIRVSGTRPDERKQQLRQASYLLGRVAPTGTFLQNKWHDLEAHWSRCGVVTSDRKRALLVTHNYADAKTVANEFARTGGQSHSVYCLVSDQLARAGALEYEVARSGGEFHRSVRLLPRSRVEDFGGAPEGAVLVAPIGPISRGHNIVTSQGYAAISTIYFLHRPHPRPDDHSTVIGMLNRATMDLLLNRETLSVQPRSLAELAKWFVSRGHRAMHEGFSLRVSYRDMPAVAREQYAWDLVTSVWQTIGRGIRGGVPVYVGFVDERFAPGRYMTPPKADTSSSSCLKQCQVTLRSAIRGGPDREIAKRLYGPFLEALDELFGS